MEEKKDILEEFDPKEAVEKLRKEQVEAFIEDKTSSESFTDIQKGMIAGWLKEAIDKGFELGQQDTIANNPEMQETMKEFVGKFVGRIESAEGQLSETYKRLFKSQRMVSIHEQSIISEQSAQISIILYELMTPEEKAALTCYGIAGR